MCIYFHANQVKILENPIYISPRAAQVRNFSIAAVNGSITLVILLIAPLGLVAVIINTLLVILATYATAIAGDRIILFLQRGQQQAEFLSKSNQSQLRRNHGNDLDRS